MNKTSRSHRHWTDAEDEYLEHEYGHAPISEIARELNRSAGAIKYRVSELRLKGSPRLESVYNRRWTNSEIEYLEHAYGREQTSKIAQELNRTESAICSQARELRLPSAKRKVTLRGRRWTDAELQYLKEAYGRKPLSEIARELDRTGEAIRKRAQQLHLHHALDAKHVASRQWTDDEIQYIKDVYGRTPASEIAQKLDRTEASIRAKAFKLQLKRAPEEKGLTRDRWTTAELEYLKSVYGLKPTSTIARELGRTEATVRNRAHRLKLKSNWLRERDKREPWTQQEDRIVREEFMTTPIALLSEKLNRTETAVHDRACVLGIGLRE